jgi:hypothetical protein
MKKELKLRLVEAQCGSWYRAQRGLYLCTTGLRRYVALPNPLPKRIVLVLDTVRMPESYALSIHTYKNGTEAIEVEGTWKPVVIEVFKDDIYSFLAMYGSCYARIEYEED